MSAKELHRPPGLDQGDAAVRGFDAILFAQFATRLQQAAAYCCGFITKEMASANNMRPRSRRPDSWRRRRKCATPACLAPPAAIRRALDRRRFSLTRCYSQRAAFAHVLPGNAVSRCGQIWWCPPGVRKTGILPRSAHPRQRGEVYAEKLAGFLEREPLVAGASKVLCLHFWGWLVCIHRRKL